MPRLTDVSMIANFAFALILLIFNCGPFVFSENRAFMARLEALKVKNVPEEKKEEVIKSIRAKTNYS